MSLADGIDLEADNSQRVDIGDQEELDLGSGDWTIEAWFKAESTPQAVIVSKYYAGVVNAWVIRYNYLPGDKKIFAGFHDGAAWQSITSSTTIDIGAGAHVALCFDESAGELHLYINGNEDANSPKTGITTNPGLNTRSVKIGSTANPSQYFDGIIQCVRISDVVRYTGNFTPSSYLLEKDANTLGLWWLDGDLTDQSDNGFDGTFEGTGAATYAEGMLLRLPVPVLINKTLQYAISLAPTTIQKTLEYFISITQPITKNLKYAIKVTPNAIQKGLTYRVIFSPVLQKSLRYTILTIPTAIQKSLRYAIKITPNVIQKGLIYRVIISSVPQKSLRYAILTVPTAIQKSLRYAIEITPNIIQKGLIYRVIIPSVLQKSLRYALLTTPTAIQKSLRYALFMASINIQKSLRYFLAVTPSPITKILTYDIWKWSQEKPHSASWSQEGAHSASWSQEGAHSAPWSQEKPTPTLWEKK